jgi:phospholipid/cholesterol/gamma-HCH transport system ATP-binding protein
MENLDFEVRRGEVFVILGGSGCGKSSLLKNMIGLFQPLAGEIWFGPDNIVTARGDDRVRILRKFGVMYQSGALFGSLNVLENVRLPLDEFTELPDEAREIIALTKLKLVSMESAAGKMPADLSGGMQKRAAIARAMALDPGILFLDECKNAPPLPAPWPSTRAFFSSMNPPPASTQLPPQVSMP